jgi:hypothetical protein
MARTVTYVSLLGVALGLASRDAVAEQQVRLDAGMTMSRVPSVDRSGTGFAVEIKGLVNDSLAIGGRLDMAFMFGGRVGNDDRELGFAMVSAALVKAEVHLLPGIVRPFVSAGAGIYSVGAQSFEPSPETGALEFRDGRFFGVAPQLGVDIGRVRLAATYNVIVGADLEVTRLDTPMPTTSDLSQNYFSVELSFAFASPHKAAPSYPPQQP